MVLQILFPTENCLDITVIIKKDSEYISTALAQNEKELDLTLALLKLEVLTCGMEMLLSDFNNFPGKLRQRLLGILELTIGFAAQDG